MKGKENGAAWTVGRVRLLCSLGRASLFYRSGPGSQRKKGRETESEKVVYMGST